VADSEGAQPRLPDADRLRARDDEIDDIHVGLTAEIAAGTISVPVAIEMGLVARYFERLGDHAVNVTRRLTQPGDPYPEPSQESPGVPTSRSNP
jgi:phosphate uptake regulator